MKLSFFNIFWPCCGGARVWILLVKHPCCRGQHNPLFTLSSPGYPPHTAPAVCRFWPLRVFIAPILCHMCYISVSWRSEKSVHVSVCITICHCFLRPPCTYLCFFHCVESQQTTVQYWAPCSASSAGVAQTGNKIWWKLTMTSGPRFPLIIWLKFVRSICRVSFCPSLLSEHVLWKTVGLYLDLTR